MQTSSILKQAKLFPLIILTLFLCQACGKSSLISSWTDESFKGSITGKILVVGVFKDPIPQKIYEDSFVAHLEKSGITAIPGYKFGLGQTQPTQAEIQKVVQESGVNTILITHLLSEVTTTEDFSQIGNSYIGLYWNSYWGYHAMVYDNVWAASNTLEKRVDRMEASLFDASTGKTIWVARSKSVNYEDYLRKDDDELEEIFINDLKKHQML